MWIGNVRPTLLRAVFVAPLCSSKLGCFYHFFGINLADDSAASHFDSFRDVEKYAKCLNVTYEFSESPDRSEFETDCGDAGTVRESGLQNR